MMDYLTLDEYIAPALQRVVKRTVTELRIAFPGMYEQHPLQPTVCVTEEAGEFAGAMRRAMGLARRKGTIPEAEDECVDVIISALCAAEIYGFDLETAFERKLSKIFTRGWHE